MEFTYLNIHVLFCYTTHSSVYWINGSILTCTCIMLSFAVLCLFECLWHQHNAYLICELYWDDTSSLYSYSYMFGLCTNQDSVHLHHQTHYKPKWRNEVITTESLKKFWCLNFHEFHGYPSTLIFILAQWVMKHSIYP